MTFFWRGEATAEETGNSSVDLGRCRPLCFGLIRCGNPKVIQTLMRHSDINLTMSAYSHAYREDEARAAEKLPDLGRRPPKKRQADAG